MDWMVEKRVFTRALWPAASKGGSSQTFGGVTRPGFMTIKCPACGETSARHQVARSEYAPVAPQLAGGIIMALVFALGRKRRFRCDRCGELFYSHTVGSRVWLTLWVLFWVSLAVGIVSILISVGKR